MATAWDPDAPDWQGLCFAPADDMFTVSPTWERIDGPSDSYDAGVRVASVEIDRGRQTEFDRTDTGTMVVTLNDPAGVFDPSNTGGPFFGQHDSKPIAFSVRDPVADEWWPRFRGVVDEISYDLPGSQVKGTVQIRCVDFIDYLTGFELAPGIAGDWAAGAGGENAAGYENAGYIYFAATDFQTRCVQALTNAGIPSALTSVFTGNVDLPDSVYGKGESIATVLHDACEAEWPTVAQFYCDKEGFVVCHGREARFDPVTVAASASHWDFNEWKAGDGAAIATDSENAQLRPPFQFVRSRSRIYNAALSYPQGLSAQLIPFLLVTENGSIATHGVRSWSAPNLKLAGGFTTGLDAGGECALFNTYIVQAHSAMRNRLEKITLRPLRPTDARAAATWAHMSRVDISDQVTVRVDHPGGGGFNEAFFVEGISETYEPLHLDLDTGYPNTTMTLNLSPAVYWDSFPELS